MDAVVHATLEREGVVDRRVETDTDAVGRLDGPALGLRGYGADEPDGATKADEVAYDAHRLALGAPGPADWAGEGTYPIEANFDLLDGIDFHKGCFVGQETTSRMKRRGTIKSRMLPIAFDGPAGKPARAETGRLVAIEEA